VGYFFEGLPASGSASRSRQDNADTLTRFLASAENLELVSILPKLTPACDGTSWVSPGRCSRPRRGRRRGRKQA